MDSIALAGSGSGTVLGQVLSSGTVMVTAPTGGTPIFSTTEQSPLRLSQDGTQIATSTAGNPEQVGPILPGLEPTSGRTISWLPRSRDGPLAGLTMRTCW